MNALLPLFKADEPGTSPAVNHVPFTSFATNACTTFVPGAYEPTALQLPDDPHETCVTEASPEVFSDERPGTSIAVPHVPPALAITGTTWVNTHNVEARTTVMPTRRIGRRRSPRVGRILKSAARSTKRRPILLGRRPTK